jgi:hypothetical protein
MNGIYQKITDNIFQQFKSFINNETDSNHLNSNMILHLSTMFKYKANGMNGDTLNNNTNIQDANLVGDVYVPITRLEKSLQEKLKDSVLDEDSNTPEEIEEEKIKISNENSKVKKIVKLKSTKPKIAKNETLDLCSEYPMSEFDESGINQFNPAKFAKDNFNNCDSLHSVSMFSDINRNNEIKLDNNFDNILDSFLINFYFREISTIYGKKSSNGTNYGNNSSVQKKLEDDSMFFLNDKSFLNFDKKLKSYKKEAPKFNEKVTNNVGSKSGNYIHELNTE